MNELWDKLDPGFLAPVWLIVGVVAVIAVILLEIGASRSRREAVRLFTAPHLAAALTRSVSPFKRIVKRILLILAVALLFIAMARPHLFYEIREENRTGLDVLLAVDCSKSMLTEDVKPNRIERAKLSISDFADRVPDNRLGLIAFAGDAFLECPLTLDHDAFHLAVGDLDTDTIPRPGTDIATAINLAVDALKSQSSNTKILILVTDGEDLEGQGIDAARAAAAKGLKIYTVGVGTPAGGLIPEQDDSGGGLYHRDANGEVVTSKLDEDTLREIASVTGGAYVPLGQQGEGLAEIYNRYIGPLPHQIFEGRREKIPLERFEWPLGLAILLLMLEFILNERAKSAAVPESLTPPRRIPRRRATRNALTTTVPLVAVLFALSFSGSPVRAAATDMAENDYQSGKYKDAEENYQKAINTQPDRSDAENLEFNLGDAAYRAAEYNRAEEAFRRALDTPDLALQENAYYNLGNSQFKHGETMQKADIDKTIHLWEEALHSYDSALKLKNSADTRRNYDIVKKKLDELKKQQQEQQDKNGQSQPDKKNQSGKPSPQNGQGNGQSGDGKSQQGGKGQNQGQAQGNGQQQGNGDAQYSLNQAPPGDKSGDQQGDKQGDKQGDNKQGQKPDASTGGDQTGNSQPPSGNQQGPLRTYSGTRAQDQQDPGIASREDANNLLDSLKDAELRISARAFLGTDAPPPPPPSGKDW